MREFHNSLLNPLPWKEKGATNISRDINNALMDYGATISLNNVSWIDWETYPFQESKFYQTQGSLEPVVEKKKSSFPTREAYVICILHENHKKYFSQNSPFSPREILEQWYNNIFRKNIILNFQFDLPKWSPTIVLKSLILCVTRKSSREHMILLSLKISK